MPNKFINAWRDFDGDRQEVSYDVSDATLVADFTGFFVEMDKWTAGAAAGGGFFDDQSADSGAAATNPLAQNSLQAIVEFSDNVTGSFYTKRIPMPNLAKADDGSSNPAFTRSNGLTVFNPDHADYATLVTEWETHVVSRNGNPITVSRIYIEE